MNKRQTFYFKSLEEMKDIAKEINIELNGSTFEELFWDKYVGEDKNIKYHIKLLYTKERNMQETLQSIIELMAYDDDYKKKENVEFIKIVRDAIGSSEWLTGQVYIGDYSTDNQESYLDYILNILDIIADELEERANLVKQPFFKVENMKPWNLAVSDDRREEILKKESNYNESVIQQFRKKKEILLQKMQDGIMPGRALDLIIENWEFFWNYKCTYEAVEYCLVLSQNISEKILIRKNLREFCKGISDTKSFK